MGVKVARTSRWTGSAIADMVVIETANPNTRNVLAELMITRINAGEIRLFADHFAADIREFAEALPLMLREGKGKEDFCHE